MPAGCACDAHHHRRGAVRIEVVARSAGSAQPETPGIEIETHLGKGLVSARSRGDLVVELHGHLIHTRESNIAKFAQQPSSVEAQTTRAPAPSSGTGRRDQRAVLGPPQPFVVKSAAAAYSKLSAAGTSRVGARVVPTPLTVRLNRPVVVSTETCI